jgi:hypothetical protein
MSTPICILTKESINIGDDAILIPYDGTEVGGAIMVSIQDMSDGSSYKGVVYYIKDEWGNEAPYDFKNIMFKRGPLNDSDIPDEFKYGGKGNTFNFLYSSAPEELGTWHYTFALKDLATGTWHDASVVASVGLKDGVMSLVKCYDNKIGSSPALWPQDERIGLNGIVYLNVFEDISDVTSASERALSCNCYKNSVGLDGDFAALSTFGHSSYFNKIDFLYISYFGNDTCTNVIPSSNEKYYPNFYADNQGVAPIATKLFDEIWKGTQEEYDEMDYHNPKTMYIIVEN